MKFFIRDDGTVNFVHSDMANSLPLGERVVTRASNVEYNQPLQRWEAIDSEGKIIASGVNRDDVIKEEVRIITERLRMKEI